MFDICSALEVCDGTLLHTAESYEHEAVAAVKKWYAETGRSAYLCGPLIPPKTANTIAKEKQQSNNSAEIQEFLDSTLNTAGRKSLLYVCRDCCISTTNLVIPAGDVIRSLLGQFTGPQTKTRSGPSLMS